MALPLTDTLLVTRYVDGFDAAVAEFRVEATAANPGYARAASTLRRHFTEAEQSGPARCAAFAFGDQPPGAGKHVTGNAKSFSRWLRWGARCSANEVSGTSGRATVGYSGGCAVATAAGASPELTSGGVNQSKARRLGAISGVAFVVVGSKS